MKNNADRFLTSLRSLRHQLAGVMETIDLVLDAADRPSDAPEPGCPHPVAARIPTPAMGHPRRFRCMACEQEVEA